MAKTAAEIWDEAADEAGFTLPPEERENGPFGRLVLGKMQAALDAAFAAGRKDLLQEIQASNDLGELALRIIRDQAFAEVTEAKASTRTDGDRVKAALKAAVEQAMQAMRNSNMGQVESYRINLVISLIERIRVAVVAECAAKVRATGALLLADEIERGD